MGTTDEIIYGNTITLPNGNALSISHIHLELNVRNRVVMTMESGWVFYDLRDCPEGTPAEEICYSRYAVYSPDYDFNNIIVVDETTVDAEQIYDNGDKPDETI